MSREPYTDLSWESDEHRKAEFEAAQKFLQLQNKNANGYRKIHSTENHQLNYDLHGKKFGLKHKYFTINGKIYAQAQAHFASGVFGNVTVAANNNHERFVVKIVEARNQLDKDTMKKEIAALKKLNEAEDVSVENNTYTIIMKHKGQSLEAFLNDNDKTLTDQERLDIAIDTADEVLKLHREKGYAHLDLKPANITIDTNNKNKAHLIDFGFSLKHGSTPHTAGTPRYHYKGMEKIKLQNEIKRLEKSSNNSELREKQAALEKNRAELRAIDFESRDSFALMRTIYMDIDHAPEHVKTANPKSIITKEQIEKYTYLKALFSKAGVIGWNESKKSHFASLSLLKICLLCAKNEIKEIPIDDLIKIDEDFKGGKINREGAEQKFLAKIDNENLIGGIFQENLELLNNSTKLKEVAKKNTQNKVAILSLPNTTLAQLEKKYTELVDLLRPLINENKIQKNNIDLLLKLTDEQMKIFKDNNRSEAVIKTLANCNQLTLENINVLLSLSENSWENYQNNNHHLFITRMLTNSNQLTENNINTLSSLESKLMQELDKNPNSQSIVKILTTYNALTNKNISEMCKMSPNLITQIANNTSGHLSFAFEKLVLHEELTKKNLDNLLNMPEKMVYNLYSSIETKSFTSQQENNTSNINTNSSTTQRANSKEKPFEYYNQNKKLIDAYLNLINGLEKALKKENSAGTLSKNIKKIEMCETILKDLKSTSPVGEETLKEQLKKSVRILSHKRIGVRRWGSISDTYLAAKDEFEKVRDYLNISQKDWNNLLSATPDQDTSIKNYTYHFFKNNPGHIKSSQKKNDPPNEDTDTKNNQPTHKTA